MTFATPLFLLAGLAAIIPLVLHLTNRQKAKVMPFSTLRFLSLSVQRTRRRKYLHDVLLLLLRIAALILIAIGLARPTISHLRILPGRQAARAAVLVLDNSASMTVRDESGPRWQMAQQACSQLLEQFGDRDQVALLLSSGPPHPQLDRLYRNHEVVRQALESSRPSYERADLAARLQTARDLLHDAGTAHKEIYIITDRQAVSWNSLPTEPPPDQDQDQKPIPIVVVDVQGEVLPNVGLRTVDLRAAAPVSGMPFQARVELEGDPKTTQQRRVELYVDGDRREVSPTLTLEAGRTAEHEFQIQFQQPGLHRGEIRLVGNDAGPLDDRVYFAVAVDPTIPVAVVKPTDHDIPYLEDTYYLQRALSPLPSGDWAIRPTTFSDAELSRAPLADFTVVFCVNLPAPEEEVAIKLHDYVLQGGHLIWICGDNVDPTSYGISNDRLGRDLLPAPLIAIRQPSPQRPDGWHVGWIDAEHPALAPLTEPASLYRSVLVYKHVQVSTETEGLQVLARLDDGEPLLVGRSVGAGSVHMLGTSAHVGWSNLPLRPLFLPLVARLTFHLAGADAAQPQLLAGTPLVVPVVGEEDAQIQILLPSGQAVQLKKEHDQHAVRYSDTHEIGIYQVRTMEAKSTGPVAFAVNPDPGELAATEISRDELRRRLGEPILLFCNGPDEVADTVQRLRKGKSLWELFLIGVLLTLVAESYLANRLVTRQQPLPDQHATARRLRRYLPEVVDIPGV